MFDILGGDLVSRPCAPIAQCDQLVLRILPAVVLTLAQMATLIVTPPKIRINRWEKGSVYPGRNIKKPPFVRGFRGQFCTPFFLFTCATRGRSVPT
jgi:hypothetical protein